MKKSCFFIGPIGDDQSDIRDWSDQVLEYIVTPAVTELDYDEPIRADKIPAVSSISSEIMRHLVEDDLVIADLTSGNPNAFYELALRHALKKPVVHIIREGEKIPFDVRDITVISVSIDNLSKADKAKKLLKTNIQAVEKNGMFLIPYIERIQELKQVFDSPISSKQKEELFIILDRLDYLRFGLDELKTDVAVLIRQLGFAKGKDLSVSSFRETRLKKAEIVRQQSKKKKK